jgi:hypothetical protein
MGIANALGPRGLIGESQKNFAYFISSQLKATICLFE